MRHYLTILTVLLLGAGAAQARGLLLPVEKTLPPLALLNHHVTVAIEDQVAVTRVEQTFRNHTDRDLEATYIFPVPKGASVNKFTMWVDGKETTGEMLEATKARDIYTAIVRRTQDPGLLEYMDNQLLRMRVFPVPRRGDQKVALAFTAIAQRDKSLVEYIYPLKTDSAGTTTLEDFTIKAVIKSQHEVQNVYSPTHAITVKRANDHEVTVQFDRNQGLLDKDFQLFYSLGDKDKDVSLTTLCHRPISSEPGYFLMMISPKVELAKKVQIPRDLVLVLDTSGSMRLGNKMEQARKALKYCLKSLSGKDRFAIINFGTTVNTYKTGLLDSGSEQLDQAMKWIDSLQPSGGTAINDALLTALDLRAGEAGRSFTIAFFTDGQPTIGETRPEQIIKNVAGKNTQNTRVFTFGVGYGDNINASMLDQLAEQTRAVSTFVRPEEDIDNKVTGLFSKISHPVLTNLKLAVTNDMGLTEIYPPQIPDLFHGGQVLVMGRYQGKGAAAIKLAGMLGKDSQELVYETTFPGKTDDDKAFVEHLWARRKVGYMLDQVRLNGEKKELVDEIVVLAKRYGITTPYTSYLVVPDSVAMPVVPGRPISRPMPVTANLRAPEALQRGGGAAQAPVADFAREVNKEGGLAANRDRLEERRYAKAEADSKTAAPGSPPADGYRFLNEAKQKKDVFDKAREALAGRDHRATQAGQIGVNLSEVSNQLRNQSRLEQTAQRNVAGRNCMEIGGVWIDERFDPKMRTVVIKSQSDAYFRILEKQPKVKEVFQLGNHLVWVAPSGAALVIDTTQGQEKIEDKEIDELFTAQK